MTAENDTKRAEIAISRMSSPEVIRIRIEIGHELIDLHVELADFCLALTGRGATPATIVRRITRGTCPEHLTVESLKQERATLREEMARSHERLAEQRQRAEIAERELADLKRKAAARFPALLA
jgi:hypothetical protein